MMRVVVVGAGRAGMVHARNFAAGIAGARLVGVADPSEEARQRATAELGLERTFGDSATAVTDNQVDAVVIGAPTFAHAELAVPALLAGKHVLCEKPLAASVEEGQRIVKAARDSEGIFMTGFMRRFDPNFVRAAERIAAGEIGEPLLVRSTGRGPGLPPEWAWDPQRSQGLIAEVNSHDLDTVRWLSGKEFLRAHAFGRAAKHPDLAERYEGFIDLVVASFELTERGLAQIDGACPADYGYDARVEVYGTEGTILVGSPTWGPLLIKSGEAKTDPVHSWRTLFADAYRAEATHFVAAARGDQIPRTSADDGLRALEAAVAVNLSLTVQRPVEIKEVR